MQLSRDNFRDISLIFDEQDKIKEVVRSYSGSSKVLIVTDEEKYNSISQISPKSINQYLGQELDCIIFDARENFNVNAFVAISGCLSGGGKLVINLPRNLLDNDGRIIRSDLENKISPTLIRLIEIIEKKPAGKKIIKDKTSEQYEGAFTSSRKNFEVEQQKLVEKIKRCALGHAKRPLVITANRGRGKSAALGISAAEIVYHNSKNILITAPRKDNVNILYQHFNSRLLELFESSASKKLSFLEAQKLVRFVSPDEIIDINPTADFVIVEEAGAIPIQLLEEFVNQYNRLTFSTTVNGYEGNGQGFRIRFKAYLDNHFPQWHSTELIIPVRWPLNDPLELAINRAFLLSFDEKYNSNLNGSNLDYSSLKQINYVRVKQADLNKNEELLQQIYQLLVTAHYQTRPSDLERMLSDQSLLIFIATLNKKVIATALISIEGKLTEVMCNDIEKGLKRIAGNLLPQSLMAYQGDASAGKLKYWRIMRIATQPPYRRQGVARQLLTYVESEAEKNSIDIIGSSFSLNAPLISFWYQQNFKCCRIALRKDSSTGSYPGEFIKLIKNSSHQATLTYNRSLYKFSQAFLYSISSSYKGVHTSIIDALIEYQSEIIEPNGKSLNASEISRYLSSARSYEMIEWELFLFIKNCLIVKDIRDILTNKEKAILIAKSFQKKSWEDISLEFKFNGKKTSKSNFRKIISKLYSNNNLISF